MRQILTYKLYINIGTELFLGFPDGLPVKNLSANAGDMDLVPGLERSPGEGNGYSFQYSCLGNPMDKGLWWATVYWIPKSWT